MCGKLLLHHQGGKIANVGQKVGYALAFYSRYGELLPISNSDQSSQNLRACFYTIGVTIFMHQALHCVQYSNLYSIVLVVLFSSFD